MQRPLVFVVLAFGLSAANAGVQPSKSQPSVTFVIVARPLTPARAPADEYFGRYKLSILGIRNVVRDMTIEGNSPLALPLQAGRIGAAESSLADWANKYSRDPWLPSTMVRFETFLVSKQEPQYDLEALSLLYFLVSHFPGTWYERYAKRRLTRFDLLPDMDLMSSQSGLSIDRSFPVIQTNH